MVKETKKKNRGSRQRRKVQKHKRSVLTICGVVILLTAIISIDSITLKAKDQAYQAQETELEQKIEDEKERAKEIEVLDKYVGTDEYVEVVAKEKLGLVHENEIIFRAK